MAELQPNFGGGEYLDPGGGQQDGQWVSLHTAANLYHTGQIVSRQFKVGLQAAGALPE